jgi:hexosaminidase
MAYPRACAMAEVTWSQPGRTNWDDFVARLKVHKQLLKGLGINYFDDPQIDLTPVGHWESKQMSTDFKELDWDISKAITKPGKYEILMQYTGGAHRLDIAWVAILADGKEIGRDTHEGHTGATDTGNDYVIVVPEVNSGEKFTLKAQVKSDGGTDSNGTIVIMPVP